MATRLEGQQLRYCGLGHGYDDVFVKGNPGELKASDTMEADLDED